MEFNHNTLLINHLKTIFSSKLYVKIQFVPHREHRQSPLQIAIGYGV